MSSAADEICCSSEDKFLLIKCKGRLRTANDRSASIEDIADWLLIDLDEYLRERDDTVSNYSEPEVRVELEKRILRWVDKGLIPVKQVNGISFCVSCGASILAGRNKCRLCSDNATAVKPLVGAKTPPRRGMHFRK